VHHDRWAKYGAAAGAIAVVLYLIGGALSGTPEDYGGPPAAAVAYLDEKGDGIQLGAAFFAAAVAFLLWFLATVASLARASGSAPGRAGSVAFGCGVASVALFMADDAALVVGTLRPENMAAEPELAAALLDFSFVAIAMASFLTAAVFAAFGVIALRDRALWPPWLGWVALAAAGVCCLRIGTLFTTEGAFTAAGALGFYAPVAAFVVCTFAASVSLLLGLRHGHNADTDGRSPGSEPYTSSTSSVP
jgi:hypothetical protein